MNPPDVARTVPALRDQIAAWRAGGAKVALVPTMGALHEGHLALVRRGREAADRVVVSIFVNPKQFGQAEDFAGYPRDEDRDRALLAGLADLVYAPSAAAMYPAGFCTEVSVAGPSAGFEGNARPGHFAGMATVVTKLFLHCAPDLAIFGEKDWQQLQVVRRLVGDLDLPLDIVGHPVVRDEHGLALSSRNARLSEPELALARRLNLVLREVAGLLASEPVADALGDGRRRLAELGFGPLDYLTLVEGATLTPLEGLDRACEARLLVAVRLGPIRLLDNLAVETGEVRNRTAISPR